MTGKQKYEERRKLEAERRLRQEREAAERRENRDEMEKGLSDLFVNVGRIADALEMLASQQADK